MCLPPPLAVFALALSSTKSAGFFHVYTLPSHPRRLRGQEILMCAMCDNLVLFLFVTPFSLCESLRGNSTCQINGWKIPGFLVQNSTNGELAFVSRYVFKWQCHAIRAVAICMLLLLHMAWNVGSMVHFMHASCECCRCRAFFRIAMADSLRFAFYASHRVT